MNNNQTTTPTTPLKRFLASPVWDGISGVLAIVGFLLSLGALWELLTGNVRVLIWLQTTAYALPLLIGALIAIFLISAYFLISWRVVPSISHFSRRQHTNREARYSGRTRGIAFALMLAALSLALISTIGYDRWLNTPKEETVVLIADFLDPEGRDSMAVTRELVTEISRALTEYPNIQVRPLGWPIADQRGEGSADARRFGELSRADIVIWGDYRLEPELAVYVHFDLLNKRSLLLDSETYRVYGETHVQQVADAQPQLSFPATVVFSIALGKHVSTLVALAAGMALFDNESFSDAQRLFDFASQIYGSPLASSIEPVIHYLRATTYLIDGELKTAIGEYTAALRMLDQASEQDGALTLEMILLNRGVARQKQGDIIGSIDDFDQVIDLDPQNAHAYNNRGLARTEQGDLVNALQDFNHSIALDPKNPISYLNRGIVRRGQDDMLGAIRDFDEAITLNPRYCDAFIHRGAARGTLGNYDSAISDFDTAIAINPQDAGAYSNRGVQWAAKGDLSSAVSDFKAAIDLDPNITVAYYNRALARHRWGDLDGAISDYNQAIVLEPEYAHAYNNRATVRLDQDDLVGALRDLDQAIILDPSDALAYYNRGIVRRSLNDLLGAIGDYSQAIDLDPQYTSAYINRGIARMDTNDLAGAISDYTQAITFNPHDASAYINRGVARTKQGDFTGAISDFDQALAKNPQLTIAYVNRGVARQRQGDLQGAIRDYVRYIELAPNAPDRASVETQIAELETQINRYP